MNADDTILVQHNIICSDCDNVFLHMCDWLIHKKKFCHKKESHVTIITLGEYRDIYSYFRR